MHFLTTAGLLQGLMFWWLWRRNLSGQGSCDAFGDVKADSPNPSPGACGKRSYYFQWGDWVTLLSGSFYTEAAKAVEGEDNPGAFRAALLRRGSTVCVFRCFSMVVFWLQGRWLSLAGAHRMPSLGSAGPRPLLFHGQVTNDTSVLLPFWTDLPG